MEESVMCTYPKRLVIACAGLLLGVVPGSFAQSAQTGSPEPATPSTVSAPALSELPFRLSDYGRTENGTDTLLLPPMRTTVLVKVPLSDYLIDRATQTGLLASIVLGMQAAATAPDLVAQANQLQKGGLCLYDNPNLPVAQAGISWLATEGEYLSDGTALVSLPVDIQSDKLVVGQRYPQVALTRVRCIPNKMIDVSRLVELAQELHAMLAEEATKASGLSSELQALTQMANADVVSEIFTESTVTVRAFFVRDHVPNSTSVGMKLTSDESDAFAATRVLTHELVSPNYSTEWGALWKTRCQVRVGDESVVYKTFESQDQDRVLTIETSSANTNSPEANCRVFERSAWSPSPVPPMESSTSAPTAPSSASTAANVSDKGCSFLDPTFYCEGFGVEVGSVTEYLDLGARSGFTVDLQRGNYIVTGRCDSACNDIDLGVLNANGAVVVEDIDPDDAPTVRLSVTTPGQYQVLVSMYECSVEPCEFTVAILKESDVGR